MVRRPKSFAGCVSSSLPVFIVFAPAKQPYSQTAQAAADMYRKCSSLNATGHFGALATVFMELPPPRRRTSYGRFYARIVCFAKGKTDSETSFAVRSLCPHVRCVRMGRRRGSG